MASDEEDKKRQRDKEGQLASRKKQPRNFTWIIALETIGFCLVFVASFLLVIFLVGSS